MAVSLGKVVRLKVHLNLPNGGISHIWRYSLQCIIRYNIYTQNLSIVSRVLSPYNQYFTQSSYTTNGFHPNFSVDLKCRALMQHSLPPHSNENPKHYDLPPSIIRNFKSSTIS